MKKILNLLLISLLLFAFNCEKETIAPPENSESNNQNIQLTIPNYPPTVFPESNIVNLESKNLFNKALNSKALPSCHIVNGSFETGDFSGWNIETNGSPFRPWGVLAAGSYGGFFDTTQPQDGVFVAANGFDGSGPMTFVMYQDLYICSCSVLTWKDRIQWDYSFGNFASESRTLDVQLRDPTDDSILENLYTFDAGTQDVNLTGDTGWLDHNFDISSYAGSTVRVYFLETIPQNLTGPAQIEFDAISIVALDADGDGCCDDVDPHPNSDQTATAIIDGCDSGVLNMNLGCSTMVDLISDCAANATNHEEFVSCVSYLTNAWKAEGLITGKEKGKIQSCAGKSSLPN